MLADKGKGALVSRVVEGSIADEVGLDAGDRLMAINGRTVTDVLDYQFLSAEECLELKVVRPNGEIWMVAIEKDYSEPMGLEFAEVVFDRIRPCTNRCLFCFIDQLPWGMRKSLYIKDDDYRLSFIYGNFITLTNFGRRDWARLIEMRLSPLYISVHSTDPGIREKMLGNPKARTINEDLTRLKNYGIKVHTQIVLCPGINDGIHLKETVEKLASYWPSVCSVGIVPVGLTGFRFGLPSIPAVTEEEAQLLIEQVEYWQQRFRNQLGPGFIYLADEFYIKAGRDFPPAGYYDDYPQLENGIGLSRLFLDDFLTAMKDLEPIVNHCGPVNLVSGYSALPVLRIVQEQLARRGCEVRLIPVKNCFFGGGVTVTGLLTGQDLKEALGKNFKGQRVLIPSVMLRDQQGIFLDDMTLKELAESTGVRLQVVETEPWALLEAITHFDPNREGDI